MIGKIQLEIFEFALMGQILTLSVNVGQKKRTHRLVIKLHV